MTIKLNENERLDDLILDGMKLIQRNDEFCFSLDTVLLARFGDVIKGPTLDLGRGRRLFRLSCRLAELGRLRLLS